MDSCHSIIYLTAGEFFDSFKSDDFKEFGSSKFDTSFFVECDLLIIDDIGTEKASDYSILRLFGDDIRCMKKLSPTKRS